MLMFRIRSIIDAVGPPLFRLAIYLAAIGICALIAVTTGPLAALIVFILMAILDQIVRISRRNP